MAFCCSCVRSEALREAAVRSEHLLDDLCDPTPGDLVVVEALGDEGAYVEVEDHAGTDRRLHLGDRFIGVLGNRKSGTNLTGVVEPKPLSKGHILHLLAKGGLLGAIRFVPRYHGGRALPVGIVGFPQNEHGGSLNIAQVQKLPAPSSLWTPPPVVFVAGSSAEVGKTTLMVSLLQAAGQVAPELRIGAVKVSGTGRLADIRRYDVAGAAVTYDFVDAGLVSTYDVDRSRYDGVFSALIAAAQASSDAIFVEIGGELLEDGAQQAVAWAGRWKAPVIYVVNDALGALAGLDILKKLDIDSVCMATIRQNTSAMAQRLDVGRVTDPLDARDVRDLARTVLGRAISR